MPFWAAVLVPAGCACLVGCDGASQDPTTMSSTASAASSDDRLIDARLLVLAGSADDRALAPLRRELDGAGMPYSVLVSTAVPLPPQTFGRDGHGLYNGVVFTGCGPGGGPSDADRTAAELYAASFGVRTACLFAGPGAKSGIEGAMAVSTPLTLSFAPAARQLFGGYLNLATPLVVDAVSAFVARPAAPAPGSTITPLLTDGAGNLAGALVRKEGGAEQLVLTFEQASGASHSGQLLFGVLVWVSRGVFIGEKRAYFGPQVDDMFMGTRLRGGVIYRMSGDDLRNARRWQEQARATASDDLRLTLAFNGSEVDDTDDLTKVARDVGRNFLFVSHTFDHRRLDDATYPEMTQELT
ncbi:MAG TPA: hypothetical protein VFH73_00860, partial [Polyangia bacterium]|nr:hypothetical protein [Polyangia bacterium]